MPSDINDLDVNDIGLKGIFGERFHDETVSKKETTTSHKEVKTSQKARDAEYEPISDDQMKKFMACTKSIILFGGLGLLFYYFQKTGQMELSASLPCICACCTLAGWGVGKNAR